MGFLQRLFGRQPKASTYVDKTGLYFYIECGRCRRPLRLRADKSYDLEATDEGFTWHKTVVCRHCFHSMPLEVKLDSRYQSRDESIEKGRFLDEDEYQALLAAAEAQADAAQADESQPPQE